MELAVNTYDFNTMKLECLEKIMQLKDINIIESILELLKSKADSNPDPYYYSPSGDPYFSNPENVKNLQEAQKQAHDPNAKIVRLKPTDNITDFLEAL